jgi:hypothetical protein
MEALIERAAFGKGLQIALARLKPGEKIGSTWVAQEFNQRYGGKSVSVWAVGRWLFGEALSKHDKLLARWLRVSPEWLLFGVGEVESVSALEQSAASYSETDLGLCREIAALNGEHRRILREMVTLLGQMEQERT